MLLRATGEMYHGFKGHRANVSCLKITERIPDVFLSTLRCGGAKESYPASCRNQEGHVAKLKCEKQNTQQNGMATQNWKKQNTAKRE